VRFTVEEKCLSIDLCGCKLTKNAPYCDGETCLELKAKNVTPAKQEISDKSATTQEQK